MSPEEQLEAAWGTLSSTRAGVGVDASEIDIELPEGRLRVGVDGYGARHLLIPVGDQDIQDDRRSAGVVMVEQALQLEDDVQRYADVVCTTPELNDVFTRLASDICDSLLTEPEHALAVTSGVLDRWRQLLARAHSESEFSLEKAVGLQGELLLLEAAAQVVGPSALEAWTGPERLHHDFRAGETAIEVKCTTAREGLRVEIHGIEQLDHSADVQLHLAVLRLIADPSGDTLPETVERVASIVPRGPLLDHLEGAGYSHGSTHAPGDTDWPRHVLSELFLWHVGEEFPAIRRGALPPDAPAALERVRYVLNLAAAGPPLGEDEVHDVLSRLGAT